MGFVKLAGFPSANRLNGKGREKRGDLTHSMPRVEASDQFPETREAPAKRIACN